MGIEVNSARLNREGLFLKVECKSGLLRLHDMLCYGEIKFHVTELAHQYGSDEAVYEVFSLSPEVFEDQDISKWTYRLLKLCG